MADPALARNGNPAATGRSYSDGITKASQDGEFHSCYSPAREICFFVPLST